MNYSTARQYAYELLALLEPACDRIEIAGSVRRHKADDIKDVEIVCISKPKPLAVFGQPLPEFPIHALTDQLRSQDVLTPRHDKNGHERWGEKNRLASWNGVSVDLHVTTREKWGVIFALRTGDADFSRLLVTQRSAGGAMPEGWHIEGGRLHSSDDGPLCTPEESDVFHCLGLPLIHPRERSGETLTRVLKERALQ